MSDRRPGIPEVGTELLLENDRVKVWDFVLQPGEAVPMHTHRLDHVIVVVDGGELEVEYGDGRKQRFAPQAGDHHYMQVDEPDTHDARNVGQTRYRNLIVELKEPRRS